MADTPLYIPSLEERKKFHDYRKDIWGDSFNWAWGRKTTDIRYLVIHHTVTSHEATPDDIAALHKARGWNGLGYHFVITKDGIVYYVGDVSTARANVKDMNEKVIGIAIVGDFTKFNPSDEQIISAHELCKFFIERPNWPNVNSWECMVGHKELQASLCPGTYWKGVGDSIYERIKNRIPYAPQAEPPTNWEAKYLTEFEEHKKTKEISEQIRGRVGELSEENRKLKEELEHQQDWGSEAREAEKDRENLWGYIASTVGWNKGWDTTTKEEGKTVLGRFSEEVEAGKRAVVELNILKDKGLAKDVGDKELIFLGLIGIFRKLMGKGGEEK